MLREAIESIFNQTHKDILVWLYDDASDFDIHGLVDNQWEGLPINVCQAEPVTMEERIRPGSTRWPDNINFLIDQIPRGEYITYLCDDDVFHPEWLEAASTVFEQSEATHLLLSDMYYFDDGYDPFTAALRGFPADIEIEPGRSVMWWNLGAFANRSDCHYDCGAAWGEGHMGYAHSWDISLIESLKAAHPGYIFLPIPSVYRREHPNTISARMGRINEKGLYYKAAEEMRPEHLAGFLE